MLPCKYHVIARLDMVGCDYVFKSPNKANIMYIVHRRLCIKSDLCHILEDLSNYGVNAKRVIIYCHSRNVYYFIQALLCYLLLLKPETTRILQALGL